MFPTRLSNQRSLSTRYHATPDRGVYNKGEGRTRSPTALRRLFLFQISPCAHRHVSSDIATAAGERMMTRPQSARQTGVWAQKKQSPLPKWGMERPGSPGRQPLQHHAPMRPQLTLPSYVPGRSRYLSGGSLLTLPIPHGPFHTRRWPTLHRHRCLLSRLFNTGYRLLFLTHSRDCVFQ